MNNKRVPVRRMYVDGPDGQIHLRVATPPEPTSRPLFCFHLSPVSGIVYENWIAEMGRDRHAVAPDTPGYGMSDPPREQPTIASFARTMGAVMDKLEVGEADVMGYHTGSKTCVELARQQPERIKHLVLVSAPVYTEKDLAKQNADMGQPDELQEDGSHLLGTWAALWRWRGPEQTPADIMRTFPDHIKGGDKKHWGHAAAFAYTFPPTIPDVAAPILVLNANDDLVVYTQRIREYLTNGKVLELPDWGHGFLDYHTEETAAFVRPFLDENVWPEGAA
jgi:pimeloyl-ACP methyl ester carboxylesterase